MADNWISPTGHNDPDSKWYDEDHAYDNNVGTSSAIDPIEASSWSTYLELTHSVIICSKVKFHVNQDAGDNIQIDIDVYYGSAWHDAYQGTFTGGTWVEKSLSGNFNVTKLRIRLYNGSANPISLGINEACFFQSTPTVTTQSPTDVLPTTVTANGNILHIGGSTVTVRGFKYGLTQVDTWDEHDNGSFSAGAFTKGLTGLESNTTYWIRAYATNSIGTSYGDWVEFKTAASGTIPTGTKLDICSDYSGYTYQLQRSETDDGETYVAYFVISTDLSNKKALAYYKRILDLWLYFNSEASGTATITVKRDNEADWQAVGSVSLTGTADIIVQHLATRIYGKHFLFKISAANHFEFLGCLFEFLPGGMR